MRKSLLALSLCLGLTGVMMNGCAGMMQGKSATAYDQQQGTRTLAFENKIYQTRGEALPLKDDQVVSLGIVEGLEVFQLKGGGGGQGQADLIYVKTVDGRYQPLTRIM